MPRPEVVVVGAGTTGSVVAARLAEDPRRTVVLLEAGPGGRPGGGIDPFAALAEPGRTWPGLTASRRAGAAPEPYWQGRGLGGSSAINGMVAAWGTPADYDRWEVPGWSAVELTGARARVEAMLPARPVTELGYVNRAVAAAAGAAGEPVRVTASAADRISAADAYLATAGPNLTIRVDTTVDRLLLAGRTAHGVRLTTGEEVEAAEVVVCAGAIHSPTLLLRSGVERPGLGGGLQDHPAVRIGLPLTPHQRAVDRRALPFGVTVRTDAAQVLPMDHTGDIAAGGLLVALMASHARGYVDLADGEPAVAFDLFADDRDRSALAAAVAVAARLAEEAGLDAEVPSLEALGDVFHAAGTCRMGDGAVVDARLRLIGYDGVRVADASIIPILPRAHPMLTCALVGERLIDLW